MRKKFSKEERVAKFLIELGEKRSLIQNLFELEEREFFVICRRFGLCCSHRQTLEEVGRWLGVIRETVRKIESKALFKLANVSLLSTTGQCRSLGIPIPFGEHKKHIDNLKMLLDYEEVQEIEDWEETGITIKEENDD